MKELKVVLKVGDGIVPGKGTLAEKAHREF